MKRIFIYIREYFYETDKIILVAITLITAILVFINYTLELDKLISQRTTLSGRICLRYLLYLLSLLLPYTCYLYLRRRKYLYSPRFITMLLLAPALFVIKTTVDQPFYFSNDQAGAHYWDHILYWPYLLLLTGFLLFWIWKWNERQTSFYGLTTTNLVLKPYVLMLLCMMPLVAIASTQPDFLAVYPKLKLIAGVQMDQNLAGWKWVLFEISYGCDFITIELFFRGFLVLGFIKWAGKDVILPMACFYCIIHFGKPLGECISSYFGGILLGIIVYNTRSIIGGLLVHLGIAWMMEAGGWLGNMMK